ncbi:ATP-binding cassette domain-containing protein [Sphaerisporangium corydalis]|uniref:ATP-binding cassette domain-containing protein n=1 Tax=Sphaerisporangium corydalis TaxID=1441875 RepID=A0ABV9E8A6_9ACTN|nr:ATP-binding cassette domain-containing protein [Sphaerisporangium corydalis]
MTAYQIQAEGLRKRYGKTVALDGVDLSVPAGSVFGLLGPNGAGKTTVVRILATLLRPDAGTVRIGGHDLARSPREVRDLIGLTGQYAAVDEDLTGRENLTMVARLLGLPRAEARRRAGELLERFDLTGAAGRTAKTYSGGMRRRLDLAASLIGRPRVLFLDEPTSGLDPRSRGAVWDLVRALVDEGTTVLLTTQYLEEADRLAGRIAVLDHGRVISVGTPAELKRAAGGRTLDVRVTDPGRLADLERVLAGVAGSAPTRSGELVSLPVDATVDGREALDEVLRRAAAEDIAITEIALRLATLDEVFLALTGHDAREGAAA